MMYCKEISIILDLLLCEKLMNIFYGWELFGEKTKIGWKSTR